MSVRRRNIFFLILLTVLWLDEEFIFGEFEIPGKLACSDSSEFELPREGKARK